MPRISFREALRQGMREEMQKDEKVFIMGEDIGEYGGCFKVTEGMLEEFGPDRIIETPLAESVITGCGVGAAMAGYKPVVEIMFADFVTLAMDHLVNSASKMRYLHDGELDLPFVLRTPQGGGTSMGAHHSQCIEAWLMNIPGLKLVLPSNPYDAKGLIKSSIKDKDPVVFLEHKLLYGVEEEVSEEDYCVPIGEANIVREGSDLTLLTYSFMVGKSLQVAEKLSKEKGIEIEVVDLRTLRPLDKETIISSFKKTERAMIVHEASVFGGAGGELAATLQYEAFDYLDAPIERVGAPETPVPFSPTLEKAYLPDSDKIIEAVDRMMI